MLAFRFIAGESGAVHDFHVYIGGTSRRAMIAVGIYSDRGGRPNRLLSSGELTRPAHGSWNAVGVGATAIQRGTNYWLAVMPTRGSIVIRDGGAVRCRGDEALRSGLRSLPARVRGPVERSGCRLSAYLVGKPSLPPARPTPPTAPAPQPAPQPAPPTGAPPRDGCFPAPGACGLPDPNYHNVGATSSCSSLPASGSIDDGTPGSTIADRNVTGTIQVHAADVTIKDVCVTTNGGAQLGSRAILLDHGAANATIEHVTVGGADGTGRSVDQAVANDSSSDATVVSVYAYNCGECFWNGPWTITDSYMITNGMQGTSDHLEDLYMSDTTATLTHDVLLDPSYQNSTVFGDTQWGSGGPCDNHWSITNSLLAGGGFVIYTCGNSSSIGSSTMNISDNRFARCVSSPFLYNRGTGGTACRGSSDEAIGAGADSHGYWPDGGYFGVDATTYCPPRSGQTWAGNVWDNNNAPVGC